MTSPDAEMWRMIRHNLACRSGHRCEICGRQLDAVQQGTVHHRQPRGMGGTSDPDVHALERLMLLCGGRLGGVLGCHGLVEANRQWAYLNGYLVHRPPPARPAPDDSDPAKVPVVLYSGRRVLLERGALWYTPAPGPPYTARPLDALAA